MHFNQPRNQGFTLLELLVTLAILTVVAGFALPSMQGLLSGSGMSATSNQLLNSLQSARSEAIKRIVPVGLCSSAQPLAAEPVCGGSFADGWFVFVDSDGNGIRSGTDEIIVQIDAPSPAFSLTADTRFAAGVLFSISGASVTATGTPIGASLEIKSLATGEMREVKVAASGRITSQAKYIVASEEAS